MGLKPVTPHVLVPRQIISGLIEQRFLDRVLKNNQLASNICSFVVRSANTYIGSAMMIDYLKLVVR